MCQICLQNIFIAVIYTCIMFIHSQASKYACKRIFSSCWHDCVYLSHLSFSEGLIESKFSLNLPHFTCLFHHPLSYFSFQPVLHDWCNKGRGMCYPACWMVHIREPLLLIGKSSPCGSSRFPLSQSERYFTICPTPYNHK